MWLTKILHFLLPVWKSWIDCYWSTDRVLQCSHFGFCLKTACVSEWTQPEVQIFLVRLPRQTGVPVKMHSLGKERFCLCFSIHLVRPCASLQSLWQEQVECGRASSLHNKYDNASVDKRWLIQCRWNQICSQGQGYTCTWTSYGASCFHVCLVTIGIRWTVWQSVVSHDNHIPLCRKMYIPNSPTRIQVAA